MSGLKTSLLSLACLTGALLFAPLPALAGPLPPEAIRAPLPNALPNTLSQTTPRLDATTLTFARCAGRFSAAMEHDWLMGRDGEAAEKRRAEMVTLVEAVMAPGTERAVLAARIEAKFAQARLLTRATFSSDPESADWARARATLEIETCGALLLS